MLDGKSRSPALASASALQGWTIPVKAMASSTANTTLKPAYALGPNCRASLSLTECESGILNPEQAQHWPQDCCKQRERYEPGQVKHNQLSSA